MFTHLLKLIFNQWKSNLWIMAELFISFVCICFVFTGLIRLFHDRFRDLGFDINHVYEVSIGLESKVSTSFDSDSDRKEEIRILAERIRRYPGVEVVGISNNTGRPYTGDYSGVQCFRDTIRASAAYGKITPEIVSVFKYQPAGKHIDLRKEAEQGHWLVSRSVMKKLFGSDVAKGEITARQGNEEKVIAVGVTTECARMEYSEEPMGWRVVSEPQLLKERKGNVCMFIRVAPEADHDFVNRFLKDMRSQLSVGNSMVINLASMSAIREELLGLWGINSMYTLSYFLSSFFLLCAFLGVISTFWFRAQSRTAEVGLRMAAGSDRKKVFQLMMGEGLLLFALVWIPALVVVYLFRESLSSAFVVPFDSDNVAYLLWSILFSTFVMVLLILVGTWYPARQASRINPVDALHYE